MKKLTFKKWVKRISITNLMVVCYASFVKAQVNSGIDQATRSFNDTAGSVKDNVQKGLMSMAFVCGAVGLIGVFQKSSSESENAGKHYMKWFTAAGLFALAWGSMQFIFK